MTLKKIDSSPPMAVPMSAKSITWMGWFLALCTSLAFSIAPPLGRAAILSGMDPVEVLIGRFGLGALLIWLMMAVRKNKNAQPIGLYGVGSICFVGFLNGIGMIFFFSALARLHASIGSMILSTVPIFVLLILAFMGEPLTRRKVIRLLFAMTGLYVLIGPGGDLDMVGVALAMIANLFFAAQLVISQLVVRKYDTETVATYVTTTLHTS